MESHFNRTVEIQEILSRSRYYARIFVATSPAGLDTFQSFGLYKQLGYLMGVITALEHYSWVITFTNGRISDAHAGVGRGACPRADTTHTPLTAHLE